MPLCTGQVFCWQWDSALTVIPAGVTSKLITAIRMWAGIFFFCRSKSSWTNEKHWFKMLRFFYLLCQSDWNQTTEEMLLYIVTLCQESLGLYDPNRRRTWVFCAVYSEIVVGRETGWQDNRLMRPKGNETVGTDSEWEKVNGLNQGWSKWGPWAKASPPSHFICPARGLPWILYQSPHCSAKCAIKLFFHC